MAVGIGRPAMRYPGGKFRIANWIIDHFPPHKFYVEPYCGAASVFFLKPKANAEIINDINQDVVNVFRVLRDPDMAARLERLLRLTPLSYQEYLDAYKTDSEDPVEKARRTIYRSHASIGADGVSRNRAGFRAMKNFESGLTGAHEWNNFPSQIKLFTKRLESVVIENRPALRVIEIYDTDETLFYCDPPYLKATRSRRSRNLYVNEMGKTREEEEQLHRDLAKALTNIKGRAIVSGYDSELYDEIYPGWKKEYKSTRAQGNRKRVECIWISPGIQPKLF